MCEKYPFYQLDVLGFVAVGSVQILAIFAVRIKIKPFATFALSPLQNDFSSLTAYLKFLETDGFLVRPNFIYRGEREKAIIEIKGIPVVGEASKVAICALGIKTFPIHVYYHGEFFKIYPLFKIWVKCLVLFTSCKR